MNKQELVDAMAAETKLPKVELERALNSAMRIIQESVRAGDDVTLMGFGTFSLSVRKARNGYDPHSGKKIALPEIKLAKFRAGKDFKELLNKR